MRIVPIWLTSAFATALAMALTPQIALAQDGESEPAGTGEAVDPAPPVDEYQPYWRNGTRRARPDKPAEQFAREEAEFLRHKAACETGDQSACGLVGEAYEMGRGAPQVRPIAGILYSEACEAGDADSCFRLGRLNRVVSEMDARPRATRDFERACQLGSVDGCIAVAFAYENGNGVEQDEEEAERRLREICDAHSGDACRELARVLLRSEPEEPMTSQAIALLDRECANGNGSACDYLVNLAARDDPHRDLPHPAKVLYNGCVAGDALHCKWLGDRAMRGDGVVQDEAYAMMMYDRACQLLEGTCDTAAQMRALPSLTDACNTGDFAACKQVGEIYQTGSTIYSNPQSAYNFFSYACDNGQFDACYPAGTTIYAVEGGTTLEAMRLAERYLVAGCDAGERVACSSLADGLYYGFALLMDKQRAYPLYADLCEGGSRGACEILERASNQETDIPLAVAGPDFVPPTDPDDPEDPYNRAIRARLAEIEARCTTASAEFRGEVYSDEVCDDTEYVLNARLMRPGQVPWQALLWRPERLAGIPRALLPRQRVLCGGSVIRRGWILTAAHCLRDQGRLVTGQGYRVRLGVHNAREDEGVSYPITQVYQHPDFDPETFAFDIGLIRYDASRGVKGAQTNSISRVAIDDQPISARSIERWMSAYVYGWGWTQARGGTSTAELRGAKLQLSTLDECTAITDYTGPDLNAALCAQGRSGEQACTGDSGGGLVYYGDADRRPRVIGVVSAGRRCGTRGEPSRYTRVAAARDWIDEIMASPRE